MFARIHTCLLVSAIVTVALLAGLIIFLAIERTVFTSATAHQAELERAARRARDLSLYVQADIQTLLAYQPGHLDHREDFIVNTNGMIAALRALERDTAAGPLDPQLRPELDRFRILATKPAALRPGLVRAARQIALGSIRKAGDLERYNPSEESE